jgi:hypothetical protein
MTPIAAYYLYVALESERAGSAVHGIDSRKRRRPLLDRLRGLTVALGGQTRVPRPA